jgi:hypothetical protein
MTSFDAKAALFIMLGQAAERAVAKLEHVVPQDRLLLSTEYDLAEIVPDKVRRAADAATAYKLFFVFEDFLRELIVAVLTKDREPNWWEKVPPDVQQEITKLEQTEETKAWMALGSRDKSALMTLPQLLKVIEHSWKEGFSDLIRDKSLIQEARLIVHLRNTICHMSEIPPEEVDRIRQTMRDWFRVITP